MEGRAVAMKDQFRKVMSAIVLACAMSLTASCPPGVAIELNSDMYPFQACFRGTVRKIKCDKKENSWLTTVWVSEVLLKDEKFEAQKYVDDRFTIGPLFYANLQPNRKYDVRSWGDIEKIFKMPLKQAIGKEFLWSINPSMRNNVIDLEMNSEVLPISQVPSSKLASIKTQIANTGEKWAATKRYLQAEIEKQWSPSAIEEFTKHLDAKVNPGVQSYTGPRVLSGRLYPDKEKLLGKIFWYAIFNSPRDFQGIDLVVEKGSDIWILYPTPLGEPAPTEDQQLSRLLTVIGHNAFRCYYAAHNDDDSYRVLRAPTVSKLTHSENGSILVEYQLEGGGTLTMNMDSNFHMSDLKLNGEPSELWSKVFAERFENYNKLIERAK